MIATRRAGSEQLARRTLVVVVAAAVVAAPALVLRLACAGHACDEAEAVAVGVPFCSLPGEVRARVAAGYRDGRSPDILGVTASGTTVAAGDGVGTWPSGDEAARHPVVLAGTGVRRGATPRPAGLDDVAPTVAAIVGLERPHPDVRSGRAVAGIATGARPRLVVLVLWRGVGDDLARARALPRLAAAGATLSADARSAPFDAAAVAATIGTGAIPAEHGITGRFVRNDSGEVVRAWSRRAPPSVVAALGDDLDETHGGRARIGLVSDDRADRGLIGGTWYVGRDDDDVLVVAPRARLRHVRRLLASGYGRDRIPDLLAIGASGPAAALDAELGDTVAAARRAARGRVLVVVAALPAAPPPSLRPAAVVRRVEAMVGNVVERPVAGGLFLDQDALAARAVPEQRVAEALRGIRGVFADAFPGIAVSLARYC